MAPVTGIGGVFWRADDPDRLRRWYADVLGLLDQPSGAWEQEAGPTVLAAFPRDNDYFGLDQQVMINFRVTGLRDLLDQLRTRGIDVLGEEQQDGVGRFAWIHDPEGNRVELWEPAKDGVG